MNLASEVVKFGKFKSCLLPSNQSLYVSILETAFGKQHPEVYSRVRATLGAIVLLVNSLPPHKIAKLIGLDPEEVILFLTLVHSCQGHSVPRYFQGGYPI